MGRFSVSCGDRRDVDCWVLGYTYGLVSTTPTCALYVPTRRATLLEPYSGAFRLIISHCASLTAATTVLLPRHRKGIYYFSGDRARLTRSIDHQRFHSLYLDNLHPDKRAKRCPSHMDSSASRSAATLSMERLYVCSRLAILLACQTRNFLVTRRPFGERASR
jgi:hypothetical protein